jgi:hypothetical protein
MSPENPDPDVRHDQAPDAPSDRAQPGETESKDGRGPAKKPPLEITEIENLEDDAKGG